MGARRVAAAAFVWVMAMTLFAPGSAGAYATPGAEPVPGPPALPDGRIYEQVSPENKYGNAAGEIFGEQFPFMTVTEDGNGVLYSTTGPMGESASGFTFREVAKRSAGMWESSNPTPRPVTGEGIVNGPQLESLDASSDLKKTVFVSKGAGYVQKLSGLTVFEIQGRYATAFLASMTGQEPFPGEPVWIAEPQLETTTTPWQLFPLLAGASADLSSVYFEWGGELVPGDSTPDPAVENATRSSKHGAGFYEWRDGTLAYAGVLPDGSVDPYGAIPATSVGCDTGEDTRNDVSRDGSRAFFVSPQPGWGEPPPSNDPAELYVRETAPDGAHRTVLVSRDTLLPAVGGVPARAPAMSGSSGSPGAVVAEAFPADVNGVFGACGAFMYATPDGSRVFFESTDQLTALAPNDASIKEYEFNLQSETLTYLPGVTAGNEQATSPILTSSEDGSVFFFERNSGNPGEALELDLWRDGPNGPSDGSITPIVAFPAGSSPELGPFRLAGENSILFFQTNAALAGFNTGGLAQVYRYDAQGNTLTCVSCPPAGTTPLGPAYLTHDNGRNGEIYHNFNTTRSVTSDGSRVYFDSQDSLVPQDVNGHRDVYEWENGQLLLISTGTSREDAFVGDNTPSGGDVVFSTSQDLVAGDVDEAYDVYDARIPRPGDQLPPGALPCQGDVCQGPPSVPVLLGTPASASFNGLGNPNPLVKPAVKKKAKAKPGLHRRGHRSHHNNKHRAHRSASKSRGR